MLSAYPIHTEKKTCGGCFDRVGLVCVVHLRVVGYVAFACSEFRPAPPLPPVVMVRAQ